MNKTLFALSIAGVTILTVYLLKEEKEEYVEMEVNEDGETVPVEKEKTVRKIDTVKEKVVSKIKEKGIDKKINAAVAKIVTFILEHKEEIEAASLGLGLVSGVIGAMTSVVKYKIECDKADPLAKYSEDQLKEAKDALDRLYTLDDVFDHAKQNLTENHVNDKNNPGSYWKVTYESEVTA